MYQEINILIRALAHHLGDSLYLKDLEKLLTEKLGDLSLQEKETILKIARNIKYGSSEKINL